MCVRTRAVAQTPFATAQIATAYLRRSTHMDTGPTSIQEEAPMIAPPTGGVSLDTLLPVYETRMVDTITIAQPRAVVWAALEQLKTSDMPLANALGTIRAIPPASGSPAPRAKPRLRRPESRPLAS